MTKHTSGELSVLLDKLGKDDVFRAQMMRDPVAALRDIGISLAPSEVPAELSLPSKESIAADRDAIHNAMVSETTMVVFLLSEPVAA